MHALMDVRSVENHSTIAESKRLSKRSRIADLT